MTADALELHYLDNASKVLHTFQVLGVNMICTAAYGTFRLDDGELGPGFMPKRPPRVRMRASTPAAASDADGAYVAPQFRGPKGPPHSFTVHEDKAILRAFAR